MKTDPLKVPGRCATRRPRREINFAVASRELGRERRAVDRHAEARAHVHAPEHRDDLPSLIDDGAAARSGLRLRVEHDAVVALAARVVRQERPRDHTGDDALGRDEGEPAGIAAEHHPLTADERRIGDHECRRHQRLVGDEHGHVDARRDEARVREEQTCAVVEDDAQRIGAVGDVGVGDDHAAPSDVGDEPRAELTVGPLDAHHRLHAAIVDLPHVEQARSAPVPRRAREPEKPARINSTGMRRSIVDPL